MVFSSLECSLTLFSSLLLEPKSNQNQTDKGAHGHQFSSLLLKPKSNQKASAHLRWLFAQSSAHEKNALLSGISSFKILLLDGEFFESIPRPIPSHRATAFFPFFLHRK